MKEGDEIWAAMRIYETAKNVPTLKHFVWSGLDYYLKVKSCLAFSALYYLRSISWETTIRSTLATMSSKIFPGTLLALSCCHTYIVCLRSAKARVNDWLKMQESSHEADGLAWTILNTGPYMEMLYGMLNSPTHTLFSCIRVADIMPRLLCVLQEAPLSL